MKLLTIAILALLLPVFCHANDFDLGRRNGMGGTVLLSDPGGIDFLSCPTGMMTKGQPVFESGFQRKFELSDLDLGFLAGGYRSNNFSAMIGLSQFGKSNYYVEQNFKSALSYMYKYYTTAVIIGGRRVEIGSTARKISLSSISLGFAAGVNYKIYHLGLTLENINQPKLHENAIAEKTKYNMYAEIEGKGSYSLTGRLTLEKYEKPIISLGQYIRLYEHHALFWGISNNPLIYGGGIELSYSVFNFTYAASFHPVLGLTHNISFGYRPGR